MPVLQRKNGWLIEKVNVGAMAIPLTIKNAKPSNEITEHTPSLGFRVALEMMTELRRAVVDLGVIIEGSETFMESFFALAYGTVWAAFQKEGVCRARFEMSIDAIMQETTGQGTISHSVSVTRFTGDEGQNSPPRPFCTLRITQEFKRVLAESDTTNPSADVESSSLLQ